jgi:hypothetical protein
VYSRTAKVHETVGDHRAAAEHYALAATARPANTCARIVALPGRGSEMHLKRGSIEQVCLTWHKTIDHMGCVRSARTPQGGRPHAQRPQTVPSPGPAVRGRARRTRTRLPRQHLTSALREEAPDDRLQVVRVRAVQSGQFVR